MTPSPQLLPFVLVCFFLLLLAFVLQAIAGWLYVQNASAQLAEARDEADATRELLDLAERRVRALQQQLRDRWQLDQTTQRLAAAVRGLPPLRRHEVRAVVTPTYRAWLHCKECGGKGCHACRGVA